MLACNTAHLFIDDLEAELQHKFVSLIETTVEHIKTEQIAQIVLLASPTTIKSRLFENRLEKEGIHVIKPSNVEQMKIEHAIRSVIAGANPQPDSLDAVLPKNNVPILLGCTELSVIFANQPNKHIDPLKLVTNKLLGE